MTFQLVNSIHFLKSPMESNFLKYVSLACISFLLGNLQAEYDHSYSSLTLWKVPSIPKRSCRWNNKWLRGLNPYTAQEQHESGVHVHTYSRTLPMHAHTRRHRMVGITIMVGFKSLRKLVDRLTRYLFTGVMCMLKWGQQGQEALRASTKLLAEGRTQQLYIPAQQLPVKRGMHEPVSKFTFGIST